MGLSPVPICMYIFISVSFQFAKLDQTTFYVLYCPYFSLDVIVNYVNKKGEENFRDAY